MAVREWATASGSRCWLLPPPDIYARFERARGNKVLMVSGSDEHGTPSQLLQNRMVFLHKMWSMNIMPLTQKRSLIWVVLGCQTLIREVLITVALCSIEQVIRCIKKKSKRISIYSTVQDSLKKEPCNNITKSIQTVVDVSSPIDTLGDLSVMWRGWCTWRPVRRLWSNV